LQENPYLRAKAKRQEPQMPTKKIARTPSPVPLMEEVWAASRSFTLAAAVELDVFTHIAGGRRTAAEIARAANANEAAMRRLLDALVALKYLERKAEAYSLEPVAATYLVRGSELYMAGSAVMKGLATDFARLAEVVRSGQPIVPGGAEVRVEDFWPMLVRAIFPTSHVAARAAAAALGPSVRRQIGSILDVGAGSGAWSLAFAQAIPKARVTVVDLPGVTTITREYADRYGVGDRYEYIDGSLREVDFGRDRFDLAILGHIIHGEGAEWGRKLIQKCAAALRDKGRLLIAEFVPNDERTGKVLPMLFGLNMLLHTPDGDVFTMRDYRAWLKEAGFRTVKTIAAPAPSPLILASK
jgi:ubiquinone/menaquinone biosynthesis C-methylase UbiE